MSWEDSYDKWKTTPPEPKESRFICGTCGEKIYPGDDVFDIDGEALCEECAKTWLYEQRRYATEEECYGF